MDTTHLSSKGQIVIPHEIRQAHQWEPGTEFAVIDTQEDLLLMPIKPLFIANPLIKSTFPFCLAPHKKSNCLRGNTISKHRVNIENSLKR